MVAVPRDVAIIKNIQNGKRAVDMCVDDRHGHGHDALRSDKDSLVLLIEADCRMEKLVPEFPQRLDLCQRIDERLRITLATRVQEFPKPLHARVKRPVLFQESCASIRRRLNFAEPGCDKQFDGRESLHEVTREIDGLSHRVRAGVRAFG